MKQAEDGLKWAETCSCWIYVHFVHKLCCVLTANYTLLHYTQTRGYNCACIIWKHFNPCNQCFWCSRFCVNVRVWKRCWINRRVLTEV